MQIVSTFHGEFKYVTAVAREASNRSAKAKRPLRLNSHSRRGYRKPRRDERGHKGRPAPCQDSKRVQKKRPNERQRQRHMAQVESEQVYDCSSPMLHAILCASVHHVGVVKQEVDFFTKNFCDNNE
jgi:hypothetical protein